MIKSGARALVGSIRSKCIKSLQTNKIDLYYAKLPVAINGLKYANMN